MENSMSDLTDRLRAENAALKRDLQYARDGLTKGRTRMREDNERLAREAHTWSKAAESYAADAERFRWLAEHTVATGLARWVHPFQFLAEAVDARRKAASAADALDAAIAQVEQAQPVAWQMPGTDSIITSATKAYREQLGDIHSTPLFTHPARHVSDERLRELMPKAHSTVDGKLGVRCSFESAEARKGDPIYTTDQMLAFARAVLEESRK